MKILFTVTALALGLAVFAYSERQQNRLLNRQIYDYDRQNSQLLTQIENNSLQNIQTGKRLRSLQSELNSRDGKIAALSRQLELAQQQTDPDYERIEAQIRQQLNRELQANNRVASSDPRTSLVRQLSELDPEETGEILSLNAQYGEFLKDLDVSAERMEVVINALSNMIAEQNQARIDFILTTRADPAATDPLELQRQMQVITSPEAQREVLSYYLTDSELNAFSEFQEQRRSSYNPFFSKSTSTSGGITTIMTSDGTNSNINFYSGDLHENDSGQPRAVLLHPAQLDN